MIIRTVFAGLAAATLLASPTIASATAHKMAPTNACKGLKGAKLKDCKAQAKATKTAAKPAG
ncbi:hypothetical protein [Novosphingobium sp. Gsoil 351]|uniref:hypothetical protein n=1 Tax=Novosphingobium sp. Gsoil 351 TaxID=2675225 RepID=UPI0012B4A9D9|nr:hypothetical protein [Novosphingobium sp. Gsoil 351]QGN55529.1 hypothetical protein GKE62_14165 [Novosphingobium sp. Gsoil 351]